MNDIALTQTRRQKALTFVTHLLCLLILFVLPEVLFNYGRTLGGNSLIIYGKSAVYVLVFYVNYYFLVDNNSLGTLSGRIRLVLYNLAIVTACVAALYALQRFATIPPPHPRHDMQMQFQTMRLASFLLRDAVMLTLTVTLAVAIKLGDNWMKIESRRREEEAMKRRQELDSLRSQLNPHFLFNTLNSIYALIAISPVKAQEAVHELSRLLRYVLYENPSTVSIANESAFVENYVKLQRLRLPSNARVDLSINLGRHSETQIPPMLLITIIENIFKHSDLSKPVSIEITADSETIVCNTIDTPRTDKQTNTGGIGLTNLKRRLQLLYGNKASLIISDTNDKFTVTLTIPIL